LGRRADEAAAEEVREARMILYEPQKARQERRAKQEGILFQGRASQDKMGASSGRSRFA
jgi:hypothetical protein